jgi:hypothetical protein
MTLTVFGGGVTGVVAKKMVHKTGGVSRRQEASAPQDEKNSGKVVGRQGSSELVFVLV